MYGGDPCTLFLLPKPIIMSAKSFFQRSLYRYILYYMSTLRLCHLRPGCGQRAISLRVEDADKAMYWESNVQGIICIGHHLYRSGCRCIDYDFNPELYTKEILKHTASEVQRSAARVDAYKVYVHRCFWIRWDETVRAGPCYLWTRRLALWVDRNVDGA